MGRNLSLRGGYAHCADADPTLASTTLSGQGGGNDSVLTITGIGNFVVLNRLILSHGDEVADGTGGGIDFRGAGTLTLQGTTIIQNYAGYGGGINVSATGGAAELYLYDGTYIAYNTAQYSGGGIRVEGNTRVFMLISGSYITSNSALGKDPDSGDPKYGYGGGIEVIGPARADLSGHIQSNDALYGGGIAVVGGDADGVVRLFTTNANMPVEVSNNYATQTGGGIWLKPDVGNTSFARFCAADFRIHANQAQQGSAIYADADYDNVNYAFGSEVYLGSPNEYDRCGPEPQAQLGAVACAQGVTCNTVDANIAEDENGQATAGAAVLIQNSGQLNTDRISISANQGAQAIRGIGDSTFIALQNCLVADNVVSGQLIRTEESGAYLNIVGCTLTNNAIGAAEVLSVGDDIWLHRSIVWQPGKTSLTQSGGTRDIVDVDASERLSLDGGNTPDVFVADPHFEDPGHGDYRPIAASPVVDETTYIDEGEGNRDLDGEPRGTDIPIVPNTYGAADLGAYERQGTFSMVRNHGFGSDLRLWSEVTPGSATWQADGASSAGAVYIHADPAETGDLIGLSQCVRIPGPGVYALDGFGHSSGSFTTRDYVRLHWKLRPSSPGESCDGAVTTEGDLSLPNGTTFAAPAAPALIEVLNSQWTSRSTIEITTVVREAGIVVNGTTDGWFDGITLEPTTSDTIFADGFEP